MKLYFSLEFKAQYFLRFEVGTSEFQKAREVPLELFLLSPNVRQKSSQNLYRRIL